MRAMSLKSNSGVRLAAKVAVTIVAVPSTTTAAPSTPPDYGYQWATITHANNPAYPGPIIEPEFEDSLVGRGSVPYEYRISKSEVGTAEWMEFTNTFSVQGNFPGTLFGRTSFTQSPPWTWGAGGDSTYSGPGRRYRLQNIPDSGRFPVFGIEWREAAMYCNWLHNGKSSDPATLFYGAYDTSTWNSGSGPYTDSLTHEPGAKFWIPTYDEWIKAVYWDPENPNRDGWWRWANSSEAPPIPGLPGEPGATTSAGLERILGVFDPTDIPLGSYPDALSPWGLLDTASGAAEWNEEAFWPGELTDRGYMGASAGDSAVGRARLTNSMGVSIWAGPLSFRIASSVPAPGSVFLVILLGGGGFLPRRRR